MDLPTCSASLRGLTEFEPGLACARLHPHPTCVLHARQGSGATSPAFAVEGKEIFLTPIYVSIKSKKQQKIDQERLCVARIVGRASIFVDP